MVPRQADAAERCVRCRAVGWPVPVDDARARLLPEAFIKRAVAAKQPLLTRMGEEFIEGMENFGEFVFGAVLGLIYALPWAAVAAVVIALARRWVRKKKKQ